MRSVRIAVLFSLVAAAITAHADSSKLAKVDLDVESTVLVRGELGQSDWYYWADATACVCWVGGKTASGTNGGAAAVVDCKKLKTHAKMAEHLAKCE